MAGAALCFCGGIPVRVSPDSARTKNTMANVVASQKMDRNAFDLFILDTPFLRASVPGCLLHTDRTAADAPRFNASNTAQEVPKKASTILPGEPQSLLFSPEKVTKLLPARCAEVFTSF
jgi:hypothetical protein